MLIVPLTAFRRGVLADEMRGGEDPNTTPACVMQPHTPLFHQHAHLHTRQSLHACKHIITPSFLTASHRHLLHICTQIA